MLVGIIISALLISSVTVNYAFADHWLPILKKMEEEKAVKYQKEILHFDYSKTKNKDSGFKSLKVSDVKKKHIQNERVISFKVVKNLNN